MLNGDCLTDLDLTASSRQHEETGASGTLALIAVDDTVDATASCPTSETGEVEAFLEKQPRPGAHQPDQRRQLCARARRWSS